jgi:hypothetical protein
MTDDATDRLVREVLSRHVPDEARRNEVLARARLAALFEEPEVVQATELLASASPEELDYAFAVALQRGSFDPPSDLAATRPSVSERLVFAAKAVAAGMAATVRQLAGIVPVRLSYASTLRGPGDTRGTAPGSEGTFSFPFPPDLVGTNGLPTFGDVELSVGELHVFVNLTGSGEPPSLVVLAAAGDDMSDTAALHPEDDYPRLLTAAVPWPHDSPPTDLLIAVVDDDAEAAT